MTKNEEIISKIMEINSLFSKSDLKELNISLKK